MKAAIYNPYWDTMGGGERYSLAFAEALAIENYSIDIEWNDEKLLTRLESRFGRRLNNINIVKTIKRGDGYDVCFWLSDGSVPLLRAKKNILHFQFPFTNVNGSSLLNKMKLYRIDNVVCNSKFTKKFIDNEYSLDSSVVYPPVDTKDIKPKRKENIILYVGRFSELKQTKRQDVLIREFKKLQKSDYKDWKLVLAGGTEIGSKKVLFKLKKLAKNCNVEFVESPNFEKIKELFGTAKIYWSATGYEVDELKEPEKVEHFGISLVEAMSAGCVPLVYNSGGFKEIIKDNSNGYLWDKKTKLISMTKRLINEYSEWKRVSDKAKEAAIKFSYEKFNKKVSEIIK